MKIDKKKLSKLKKGLRGLQSTVARELDVHRSTVSRALDGEIGGEGIIEKCIKVRDREMKKRQKLESKI